MEAMATFHNKNHCKQMGSAWSDVIQEVAKRKAKGLQANIFSEKEDKLSSAKRKKRPSKKYGLGAKYGNTHFTTREAECMVGLLKVKTIDDIATMLGLSRYTVITYIGKMRSKLGCYTTSDLIGLVCTSEFLKNIDF